MDLMQKGIDKGFIRFDDEKKYIIYTNENKKRNFKNPEEKVQAKTFLRLIFEYGYKPERIRQFVKVSVGSKRKEIDIIVYNDDTCLSPKIIVECKKEESSDNEFRIAVDQAFSYAHSTSGTVKYIWVTSYLKNSYFRFNKEKNIKKALSDIPKFGIEKWKHAFKKLPLKQIAATTPIIIFALLLVAYQTIKLNKKNEFSKNQIQIISNKLGFNVTDRHGNIRHDAKSILTENLQNTTSVDLSYTRVKDISFLENLNDLYSLDLSNTSVSDISSISTLINLKYLNLSKTKINSISPLYNLQKIEELDLKNTTIENIKELDGLINLKILDLSYTNIADATHLANLTHLKKLNLSHTKIENADFLNKLKALEYLDLSGTDIVGLILTKLTKLKSLNLSYSKIISIPVFDKNQYLEYLNLSGCRNIDSLLSFEEMGITELKTLTLDGTNIDNLLFITDNKKLTTLYIGYNDTSDLTPLASMKNLEVLSICETKIRELKPLYNLKNLEFLLIESNPNISLEHIEYLQREIPQCKIRYK
ncbi:MAG: hypothetical protein GY756_18320 [bacterium]|nr:hypothetical protein [bacterium]